MLFAISLLAAAVHLLSGTGAPQVPPTQPAAVAAEPQIVVTGHSRTAIGMNLAGLNNGSAELPFIDYMKLGGDPAKGLLAIPIAQGPVDLVLLYDGSTIPGYEEAPRGNAVSWNAMTPTGFSRGRIKFHSPAGGSVNLTVTHLDPANPIRNIRLIRAQDEVAFKQGEIFNPDFMAFIKAFSPLRTMDWTCTNGNTMTSWSERPKPDDVVYGCAPIEVQVALANKAKSDLWLNIPALADDDYIAQVAAYVHDHLDPALKLHLEYSNEVWNGSFAQNKQAQAAADKLWGNGAAVPWGAQVYQGYRSAQMMAIAQKAFGADAASRLTGVLATFTWWIGPDVDDALERGVAKAKLGTIDALFGEYAMTTYFGDALGYYPGNEPDRPIVAAWAQSGAAGLDKAFQQLEHGGLLKADFSVDSLKPVLKIHAARAAKWHLKLVSYEGGPAWYYFASPDKGPLDAFFAALLNNPRMKAVQLRSIAEFAAAGGVTDVHFNDVGHPGQFGPWPVVDRLGATSPRLEALRELSAR